MLWKSNSKKGLVSSTNFNVVSRKLIRKNKSTNTCDFVPQGLDWICGGQFGECAKRVKEFVITFRNAGAEPVFFFDGPCQAQKRHEWIKRHVVKYRRVQQLMTRILKGCNQHMPVVVENYIPVKLIWF